VLPIINSEIIDSREVIARYLLSSSDYSSSKSRVKYRALEPSPQDQCTSVFRIDGLTENQIWDMGTSSVAEPRARRIHARADIIVSAIVNLNLAIRPDEPPVRHALISGWSDEKHARMAKAQELATEASLKVKP
jgi:hypothetical protein